MLKGAIEQNLRPNLQILSKSFKHFSCKAQTIIVSNFNIICMHTKNTYQFQTFLYVMNTRYNHFTSVVYRSKELKMTKYYDSLCIITEIAFTVADS